jgi:dihydrofolate reductase
MGKLVVTEFVSLDGVMQAPGGEDFKYPGWSFEFDRGEDGNQFKLDETLETEALLIGRVTYESFAGAWPNRDGDFADARGSGVEQHHGPQGRRRRRGHEAEGSDRRDRPDAGQPPARAHAARA